MLNRIIKNSLFVFISQGLLLVSNIIVYGLIGRKLGPTDFGNFSFVMAYIGLFTVLADFGLGIYISREVSRKREITQEYLSNALAIVTVSFPITLALLVIVTSFLNVSNDIKVAIFVSSIYLFLGGILSIFRGIYHAHEQMELETITIIVEKLASIILVIIIIFTVPVIIGLIIGYILARILSVFTALYLYGKHIPRTAFSTINYKKLIYVLRETFPFSVNVLTTTIYVQIDLVILALLINETDAGFYKAATSLVIPLAIVASALNSAMLPNMAREYLVSLPRVGNLLKSSMRYLFIIGIPISVIIISQADTIIKLIYGDKFLASVAPLKILSLIIPMRFINNSMGTGLTAVNRQSYRAGVIFISAVLNIILNFALIPKYSYIGASYATVITEIIILTALMYFTFQFVEKIDIIRIFGKPFAGGILMLLSSLYLQQFNIVINITISLTVYAALLILFRAIPLSEIRVFWESVKNYSIQN